MTADGSAQRPISNGRDARPQWSPDGTKLAFDSIRDGDGDFDIWIMNADGTGFVQVTDEPGSNEIDPAWAPSGQEIVFEGGASQLYIVGIDGSGMRQLTAGSHPSWSSDGQWIAFRGHSSGVNIIRPDGTDLRQVTRDFETTPGRAMQPDWSPDSTRLVVASSRCQRQCQGTEGSDLYTVNPDGTGATRVTSERDTAPAWSPSGQRIVFTRTHVGGSFPFFTFNAEIYVVQADGTDELRLTDNGGENGGPRDDAPAWQPINAYARPKGATPIYASLVPAYTTCTSPNREHGPPLAFGSCTPPTQTSDELTIGSPPADPARSVSHVRLKTIPGIPSTPPDEADVELQADVNDVYDQVSLDDYTGDLRTLVSLRITDKLNTPHPGGPGAGTVTDFSLGFTIPCATTPDPDAGSDCTLTTTAEALYPGALVEGRRAIWQLGAVEVYDGGADDDADTAADNSLFMKQGIFVP